MRWMRLFYYLSINVIVSAVTIFGVLIIWDQTHKTKPCAIDPAVLRLASTSVPTLVQTLFQEQEGLSETTATAFETPTPVPPTPILLSGIITHTVKTGETLGIIAGVYGVSIEAIVELNKIDDPNLVEIGRKLRIQIPSTDTPTPTQTPTITPTPTPPTPTLSPTPITPTLAPHVVIQGVIGAGDIAVEHVDLAAEGGGSIALAGWQMRDEQGHSFTFPQYTLHPGGKLSVYTGAGVSEIGKLYWNLTDVVWSAGEQVTLLNAQGIEQATYQVP